MEGSSSSACSCDGHIATTAGLDPLNTLNSLFLLLILPLHLTLCTSPWLPETSLFWTLVRVSTFSRFSLFVTPVTALGPVLDPIVFLLVLSYRTLN